MEMKKKAETKPKAAASTKSADKPAAGAKKGGKK
jgi:hypothetical protein